MDTFNILWLAALVGISSLRAQPANPASTIHVLDLDGSGSYVELPPKLFTNEVVTVEGWVKWREFGYMSRFFHFADAARNIDVINRDTTNTLWFEQFRQPPYGDLHTTSVPNVLQLGESYHIAVVAGTNEVRLYLNGFLVATNEEPSAWTPPTPPPLKNYLGRSVLRDVTTPHDADFDGQMAEVRLWAGERTPEEIRSNLFRRLTGQEPGLLALWNFADGTARDASPNGRNGTLRGNARITESALPTAQSLVPWSRLQVQFVDAAGAPLAKVSVRAEVGGVAVGSATSDAEGVASFTVWTTGSAVDLAASGANDLGGWKLGVPITPHEMRAITWKLGPATHIAGRAVAPDGKTPMANVVVELVKPEAETASARGTPALPGHWPDALTTNRVLQLDGNTYLALPTSLVSQFTAATIEGWVTWDKLERADDFFDFSTVGHDAWITPGAYSLKGTGPDINPAEDLQAGFYGTFPGGAILVPDILRAHEWFHLALVTGPGGMKLYVNGVLAGSDPYSGSFGALPNLAANKNFIGRDAYSAARPMTGRIDELCVWKTVRTADEIRSDMLTKLTGREPGLAGFWTFDDPGNPGKDSSTNGNDGQIIGLAETVPEKLPVVIRGRITDATGHGLTGASVEVRRPDGQTLRAPANAQGDYAFTLQPSEKCDLFATDGKLSATHFGFQPAGQREQRLDWVLSGTGVTAAATNGSSRGEGTPAQISKSEIRNPNSPQDSLISAATGTESGTVVATLLTKDDGSFDFPNLRPGVYQLRCQVPGGRAWFQPAARSMSNKIWPGPKRPS